MNFMGGWMETLTKMYWGLLLLVHVPPSAIFFAPRLSETLYGLSPAGDTGLLLVHRGALFVSIMTACGFAILDPGVRRAASAIVAVSVLGFLLVYLRAGTPSGPLRTIAVADAIALVPLFFVLFAAWRT